MWHVKKWSSQPVCRRIPHGSFAAGL